MDSEESIATAGHSRRHHILDLLRYHADIGLVTTDIAEAVIAEAIVEMAEQDHIVFQGEVRTPPASAATTAATAESSTTASTTKTASSPASTETAAASAGEACPAAR